MRKVDEVLSRPGWGERIEVVWGGDQLIDFAVAWSSTILKKIGAIIYYSTLSEAERYVPRF
jgi:hypothetical protein